MNNRYRRAVMWALYSLLFLLVLLIQTVVLGDQRFHGAKLSLLPVAVVCITMFTGHEAGGLFSLLAALFWAGTGADDGSLSIVTFTVCGILAGYLCDAYYARHFFPALVMSLCALILHQSAAFLFKFYLNGMEPALWRWLPAQIGLSLIACPVLYLPCKLIRKAGAD